MINVKFGASTLSWMAPQWEEEAGAHAIVETAKAGFDLIEILLPVSMEIDTLKVRKLLDKAHLDVACGLNLNPAYHLPAYPEKATELIKKAIDNTHALGGHYLGGVLHGGIGAFSGEPRTPKEEDIVVEAWSRIADYAETKGVVVGIEPVNRYEGYICTSAAEVLSFLSRIKSSFLQLHLDTFHMNIEENDFYHPVVNAGHRLWHIHMTDSDRGMLGEGNVHWDDLFRGLDQIDYSHSLVLENFTNKVPGIAEATSLWRKSKYDARELATGSLEFMREMTKKWNSGIKHAAL